MSDEWRSFKPIFKDKIDFTSGNSFIKYVVVEVGRHQSFFITLSWIGICIVDKYYFVAVSVFQNIYIQHTCRQGSFLYNSKNVFT